MATEVGSAEAATGSAHATASPPIPGGGPSALPATEGRTARGRPDAGPSAQGQRPSRGRLLLLVGVVLASLNMRAALGGVAPVLAEISDTFGMTATVASLVTTLPVLAMGLASALAPWLERRLGTEAVLAGSLVLLAGGVALRVAPATAALFGGCALVGASIALLNVLMPGLIKREFPDREAGMTAVYSTCMILGATVSAALAVPLERLLGGWRGSLLSWAFLAAVAALLWSVRAAVARRARRGGGRRAARVGGLSDREEAADGGGSAPDGLTATTPGAGASGVRERAPGSGANGRALARSWLAWQVTLFMGFQSMMVYLVMAWMPTILTDDGMSGQTAGLVFAFSTLMQMLGTFLVPTLAGRMRDQRLLGVVVSSLMAAGVTGLLVSPSGGAWAWAGLIGTGQGGALGLALTLMVLRSADSATTARLSGMSQTWGYLLAAAGPLSLGAVHELTGGWRVPITLMLGVCVTLGLFGLGAGRNRTVAAGE